MRNHRNSQSFEGRNRGRHDNYRSDYDRQSSRNFGGRKFDEESHMNRDDYRSNDYSDYYKDNYQYEDTPRRTQSRDSGFNSERSSRFDDRDYSSAPYGSSAREGYRTHEFDRGQEADRNFGSDRYETQSFDSGRYSSIPERSSRYDQNSSSRRPSAWSSYGSHSQSYGDDYRSNASPLTPESTRRGYGYEDSGYGTQSFGQSERSSSSNLSSERGFRGKGPKGYGRSDERIKEEICEKLTDHHEIDASEIEIEVKDGQVSFSGTVPNKWMKYNAEDLAEQVSGVKEVKNDIRVIRNYTNDRSFSSEAEAPASTSMSSRGESNSESTTSTRKSRSSSLN